MAMIKVKAKVIPGLLAMLISPAMTNAADTTAGEEFDIAFLHLPEGYDRSQFNMDWFDYGITEGNHSVAVELYPNAPIQMDILFVKRGGQILPCFTPGQLVELGINPEKLSGEVTTSSCRVASDYFEGSDTEYQSNFSTLVLKVPNIYHKNAGGLSSFDDVVWQEGINHTKLNYNGFAGLNSDGDVSGYLSLNSFSKFGRIRARVNTSVSYSDEATNLNWGNAYLYTDLYESKLRLSAGQIRTKTNSSVNSGLAITGIGIEKPSDMLSRKERQYSPVIKGYASTQATVSVLQQGKLLYQAKVAPGEFEITSLDAPGTSADLLLRIEESDGKTIERTIAFSRLPNLLRPGGNDYSLSFGNYSSDYGDEVVMSGYYTRGFDLFTLGTFATVTADSDYVSAGYNGYYNLGMAGAVGIESAVSNAKFDEGDQLGYKLGVEYAKRFSATGSDVRLAALRYHSKNFYNLSDYLSERYDARSELYAPKNEFTLSLSQPIGEISSYLSYNIKSYHQQDKGTSRSLYASLGFDVAGIPVRVYGRQEKRSNPAKDDLSFGVSLSVPLGYSSGRLGFNSDFDKKGATNHNVSYSGNKDDTQYSASLNYGPKNDVLTANTNVSWQSAKGRYSFGLSGSEERYNSSLSVSGGVLFTGENVLMTQSLGETSLLVDLGKGAENVQLGYGSSNRTNSDGLGVVPHVIAYDENQIRLNSEDNPMVELKGQVKPVYPSRGSLVKLSPKAFIGNRGLYQLSASGQLFGYPVFNGDNEVVSYVGEDNIVYLSGVPLGEKLVYYTGRSAEDIECRFEVNSNHEFDVNDLAKIKKVSCDSN
ncbi:fimbria/pilus outer membrane usher protein [Vibrio sp. SCSIO 43137]|uniref:fimbria/pilus outer membrane usher protein n=1 Tax=Vibrio sp. SCSIO 43137 TaxID=3021011 RepID=UPI0023079155|nr:fimbria/pilus outer membrane usher protein [Vibrio sp. SCSIO 43137]WCE31663.1 fimbria/pilus outer membrane usher protein [Vibrio sp. SCSIO 43137]